MKKYQKRDKKEQRVADMQEELKQLKSEKEQQKE